MSLDDYIKKQTGEDLSIPPEWATYYYNIDDFNIQKDKVALIKEYREHLDKYSYCVGGNRVNCFDESCPIQIVESKGGRMLVDINTRKTVYDERNESSYTEKISQEEYEKRAGKFRLVGEQFFHKFDFGYYYYEFTSVDMGIQKIYYSKDGYVYITKELANKLKKVDIDDLGNRIAKEVVKHNELRKKYPN